MYTAQQAATLLNVTDTTIRAWANEFTMHLSPTANPGTQRKRLFSRDDMAVFALVAELKNAGANFQDIHSALQNGDRGTPPDIEPDELATMIVTEQERRLQLEVTRLHHELANTKNQLEASRSQIIELGLEIARLQTKVQILEASQTSRDDLLIQIGELRAKLAALEGKE